MGWTVGGSNPSGGEIFRSRPDRLWGPPSLLYDGYRVFPGGKVAGTWRWPPTPSSADVKERVEKECMHSPPCRVRGLLQGGLNYGNWLDVRASTGFIWLRIRTSGRLILTRLWIFGVHEVWGLAWLDEELVAAQAGLRRGVESLTLYLSIPD